MHLNTGPWWWRGLGADTRGPGNLWRGAGRVAPYTGAVSWWWWLLLLLLLWQVGDRQEAGTPWQGPGQPQQGAGALLSSPGHRGEGEKAWWGRAEGSPL